MNYTFIYILLLNNVMLNKMSFSLVIYYKLKSAHLLNDSVE